MVYFSDSLVEEAAGEDSSGRSFKDRDEDGFHESEVAFHLVFNLIQ